MRPPAIAFLRPHMGIGGAERLALDAAVQYQARGCTVRFVVPGELAGPQFAEVTERAVPIANVTTPLPVHVAGRLRAPLAVARTKAAARSIARGREPTDLVFCDVVAHAIPYVQRRTRRPVLYYCHFPDVLLTSQDARGSAWYRWYRRGVDASEAAGVRAADRVLVNSAFTAGVVRGWLPDLPDDRLQIVHPGVPVRSATVSPIPCGPADTIRIISISRFDPRKNQPLAIEALAALRSLVPAEVYGRVRLVMAGHFDERLPEQHALLARLRADAAALGVGSQVEFALSPSEAERDALLAGSRCAIYTPVAEHFGYVPIEAMAAGRPVVAANQGGPTETVQDGVTGALCPPTATAFAGALCRYVTDADEAQRAGSAAVAHVAAQFSLKAFGDRLWAATSPLLGHERSV